MPGTLSGGQKQRVALARCLAHQPRLVLLDEPLSNLDAALKSTLRWQIREVLEAAGVPALWVTHDQDEALSVGDRVGIMEAGRLVQLDDPETCFRAPADRFVARFLGEGVFLPGRCDGRAVTTALGAVRVAGESGQGPCMDVLVRPHDLSLEASAEGDGRCSARPATRARRAAMPFASTMAARCSARVGHELAPGARAKPVRGPGSPAQHPLAVFPAAT
ncbi:MAG: ABC transporter ATP-binding protein [Gammaproteobacteria bacterium]|nr:ABC transporter ATP-binding protein [Gammaproteobacteria bacterium]